MHRTRKSVGVELLESRRLLSGTGQAVVPVVLGLADTKVAAPLATPARTGSIARQTGVFTAEFDTRPDQDGAKAWVGLTTPAAAGRGELATAVRFTRGGSIDVLNGSSYGARRAVTYAAGTTYHFRMVVDVPGHTYNVWVTPEGGARTVLARNAAFATSLGSIAAVRQWAEVDGTGSVGMSNVTVTSAGALQHLALPPAGKLYHGVFPGGSNTWEDDITPAQVNQYERATGKKAAWIYFSDNWFDGASRAFPGTTADWIRTRGSVPYVRLMTISQRHRPATAADPVFTLQRIIDGDFDADLRTWAQGAAAFGSPVMVEWGTEFNGDWFNWNGRYHGGGQTDGFGNPGQPDGPERFAAAYRHIVNVMRGAGASNITWVWHLNWSDSPGDQWNHFENYYPGSDVVDLIGVSAYGPLRPGQNWEPMQFRDEMDDTYSRIEALAPGKPVIISEVGATVRNPNMKAQDYADGALRDILSRRWANVVGFSWWNERWQNDGNTTWDSGDTDMRVQDSPELTQVFQDRFGQYADVIQETPVVG